MLDGDILDGGEPGEVLAFLVFHQNLIKSGKLMTCFVVDFAKAMVVKNVPKSVIGLIEAEDSLRLAELVRKALVAPKRRIPTKVSANQKRKRVEAKKARSEVKEGRGWER